MPDRIRRPLVSLAASTVVAVLAMAVVAASASASEKPRWLDGVSDQQYFQNCSFGGGATTTGWVSSWTGYWGTTDGTYPRTGDRYYGQIVAGVVGNPCVGGDNVITDIVLPPHTQFDFGSDAWGKVRCFIQNGLTNEGREITGPDCISNPQSPGAGYSGYGRNLGGRSIPSYHYFQVIFPVKTSQPLRGSGANDRMVAPTTAAISSPHFVAPQQWVWVFEGEGGGAPPAGPGAGSPAPDAGPEIPPSEPGPGGPEAGAGTKRTATQTTVDAKRRAGRIEARGAVRPSQAGSRVRVELRRRQGGSWKKLTTKRLTLNPSSRFRTRFKRPRAGSCRVVARFGGSPSHKPSTATKRFKC